MVQPVNIRTGQPIEEDGTLPHTIDYGGGNGGGDDVLKRVERLEEKVISISSDLAVIKATMCTKEDLHKELNGQTWKIVIALVVTVLIAVFSKYFIK
ncbi:hypothetical protein [Citrobacter portucalensis]|uniref:hypothetical protein n=1 Tax=Citrobacter portucalensis TaxID=1639133 RepID=UPI0018A68DD8|nr:hypothetical protein [Citrobacter portucalensis]BBV40551.1 hypothetical protein STW0522CIT26_20230 [Citrobacter portucalensis]BBW11548.1 hypothetical protein STN0717CIT27_20240 [Citrobacter portucalensis]BBW41384.1 hypothetical protein STN0717CIT72_28400 [Citrobacter portucalensis]